MNHTLKVFCLWLFRYSGIRKQAISRPRVSDSLGRFLGNSCIREFYTMYGRNRLRREPHVVFKISYVKLTALYVRASDGGD